MRVFSIFATSLGVAVGSFAAEPMKVSVYPPGMGPNGVTAANPVANQVPSAMPASTSSPSTAPNVFDGTLVPTQTRLVGTSECCETPSLGLRGRILPVAPTICIPVSRDVSDCNMSATPCGPRLTIDCGSSVCESPGRPGLLAGFLSKSACSTCQSPKCDAGERERHFSFGCGMPCDGSVLARIKNWLFFRPCDGPRIGLFRPNPYMPRSIAAFPIAGCNVASMDGTCHSAACCGSGLAGRLARGNAAGGCESGNCENGMGPKAGLGRGMAGGLGLGLGGHFANGKAACVKDCNNAEPKLSGAAFSQGYHFATVHPRTYGNDPIQIDPITGLVKMPKEKGAAANDTANVEQVSATAPVKSTYQKGTEKSTTGKDAKANPLTTPFSKQ